MIHDWRNHSFITIHKCNNFVMRELVSSTKSPCFCCTIFFSLFIYCYGSFVIFWTISFLSCASHVQVPYLTIYNHIFLAQCEVKKVNLDHFNLEDLIHTHIYRSNLQKKNYRNFSGKVNFFCLWLKGFIYYY